MGFTEQENTTQVVREIMPGLGNMIKLMLQGDEHKEDFGLQIST